MLYLNGLLFLEHLQSLYIGLIIIFFTSNISCAYLPALIYIHPPLPRIVLTWATMIRRFNTSLKMLLVRVFMVQCHQAILFDHKVIVPPPGYGASPQAYAAPLKGPHSAPPPTYGVPLQGPYVAPRPIYVAPPPTCPCLRNDQWHAQNPHLKKTESNCEQFWTAWYAVAVPCCSAASWMLFSEDSRIGSYFLRLMMNVIT
ncbi:hypothetical protein RHMOL_Rhmol09G0015900 [Rhododendron molle]|uniref:Uncharacterized protein n=1 Tax=Rhododendron molle TaxID=49168 RepID=A0ACC0MAB1_RHOML|nr:hypothetical protein RHMOL_Rhmol09G0015900 [Rhododendron molle]